MKKIKKKTKKIQAHTQNYKNSEISSGKCENKSFAKLLSMCINSSFKLKYIFYNKTVLNKKIQHSTLKNGYSKKQVIQKTGCVPFEFQLGKFQKKVKFSDTYSN